MQLVIAEKPSVARSIAGVIGADKKQDGYMEGNGRPMPRMNAEFFIGIKPKWGTKKR